MMSENNNVYSAVIMVQPLWEFTRFIRWMQAECQAAADPQTKPTNHHLHPITLTPRLKAYTHITVPQRVGGWVDLSTVCSHCTRLVVIHGMEWTSHATVGNVSIRPMRLLMNCQHSADISEISTLHAMCQYPSWNVHIVSQWDSWPRKSREMSTVIPQN